MEIVVAAEAEVPRPLRDQVLALQDQAWPLEGAPVGHDPALHPMSMLLVEDGRVLAALDILSKALEHRGQRYQASGLSTVVTDTQHRHRGHGLRLVWAARGQMQADGADVVVFTCDAPLAPFYERAGFEILPGTQLIGGTAEDPLPSGPLGKVTLAALFTPMAESHRADFVGADVVLHPGTLDRLW